MFRDLWLYQTQFNEHDHQYLKDAGHRLTNGARAGPAEELTIKAHERLVNGKVIPVQEATRSVGGKSETEQLLQLSAMRKALRNKILTAGEHLIEYQRTLRKEATSKVAMRLKLERDLDRIRNRTEDHPT